VSDKKTIDRSLALLDRVPMEEAFGEIDEIALETYGLFLSSTLPLLNQIGPHLLAGDCNDAADLAHSAKGAARMTGAFQLAAICSEIELCCKQRDPVSAQEWLALIPTAFEEVKRAIDMVTRSGIFP